MRVLTIKEPFATLIKDNIKKYETRSWKTNYRGELFIHAGIGKSKSKNYNSALNFLKSEPSPGYIICKCRLVDCILITEDFNKYIQSKTTEYNYGDFTPGRYAWQLELIEVLKEPIPAKGKLSIWKYEE